MSILHNPISSNHAASIEAALNNGTRDAVCAAIERNLESLPPEKFAAYALNLAGLALNAEQERALILGWLGQGAGRRFILWHLWNSSGTHLHPYAAGRLAELAEAVETKASALELLLLDGQAFVDMTYRRLLRREADAEGRAYWLGLVNQGLPKQYVLWSFNFHIPPGQMANLPNDWEIVEEWIGKVLPWPMILEAPADSFIALSYLRVLGRPVEPSGNAWWQDWMDRGCDRWDILAILLHSAEGRARLETLKATGFVDERGYRELRFRRRRLEYVILTSGIGRAVAKINPFKGRRRAVLDRKVLDVQGIEARLDHHAALLQGALERIERGLMATREQGEVAVGEMQEAARQSQNEWLNRLEEVEAKEAQLRTKARRQLAKTVRALRRRGQGYREEFTPGQGGGDAQIAELKHQIEQNELLAQQANQRRAREIQELRNDILLRQTVAVAPNVVLVRHGGFVLGVPAENWAFLAQLVYERRWEPGTQAVLKNIIQPGMTAVDVGAHIGVHTLMMARAAGTEGRVIAFEPAPRAREILERNVMMAGFSQRVQVRAQAVAESCGSVSFGVCDAELSWSSIYPIEQPVRRMDVPVTNLDTALADVPRVDVVKIDAEGAELAVLRGMKGVVARNPNIKIVMEFGPGNLRHAEVDPMALLNEIRGWGMAVHTIDELTGAIRDIDDAAIATVGSVNLLLSRPGPDKVG